jgi:anti-anti-sigma factor
MNSTLRLDVSTNDGIQTVSIAGELDAGSVADLAECLDGCRRPGARVLLDLRALNFMDSAGLELLDRTYVESSLEGWTFAVITTGERYLARAAA